MTPGEGRERPVQSVGEALQRLTDELGLEAARPAVAVHERWREAVGDEVADHAEPQRLEDGVLRVAVSDPAWGTHLRYLGPRLVSDVNAAVGAPVVREIRVVVRRR